MVVESLWSSWYSWGWAKQNMAQKWGQSTPFRTSAHLLSLVSLRCAMYTKPKHPQIEATHFKHSNTYT